MKSRQPQRPLSPHLQIYKPQYTMVLSITHRMTGVFLSAAALFLVYWLWAMASGPDYYAGAVSCLAGIWARLVLVGALFGFAFHLCNGIRHLAWDLGYGYEKAQARASGWAVVIVALLLTVAGSFFALRLLAAASPELGGEV
jgi:succinate dehydrogenase / fumarate reductase cytochrome b subunit